MDEINKVDEKCMALFQDLQTLSTNIITSLNLHKDWVEDQISTLRSQMGAGQPTLADEAPDIAINRGAPTTLFKAGFQMANITVAVVVVSALALLISLKLPEGVNYSLK